MTKIFQTFSLTILIALSSSFSYAIEEEKNELSLQEEITEYINHHVQDSHDFSLFSTKDKKTGEKSSLTISYSLTNKIFKIRKVFNHEYFESFMSI